MILAATVLPGNPSDFWNVINRHDFCYHRPSEYPRYPLSQHHRPSSLHHHQDYWNLARSLPSPRLLRRVCWNQERTLRGSCGYFCHSPRDSTSTLVCSYTPAYFGGRIGSVRSGVRGAVFLPFIAVDGLWLFPVRICGGSGDHSDHHHLWDFPCADILSALRWELQVVVGQLLSPRLFGNLRVCIFVVLPGSRVQYFEHAGIGGGYWLPAHILHNLLTVYGKYWIRGFLYLCQGFVRKCEGGLNWEPILGRRGYNDNLRIPYFYILIRCLFWTSTKNFWMAKLQQQHCAKHT